jgi:nucleoside-diphosphate-sugar epimerase
MKLVLGGNGFIGKHLVKHLEGHQFDFLSPRSKELDITKPLQSIKGIKHVYHLAGQSGVVGSWKNFPDYHLTNVQGTANVLDFCHKHNCSLTYISSYIYGIPEKIPIDETAITKPSNPYSFTKYLGEEICKFYAREYGVTINILRLFNVYGPGQGSDFLISKIIRQFTDNSKKDVCLESLTPRRDFVFVKDVIDAILLATKNAKSCAIYNIGSGRSYSVEEIVQIIKKILNSPKNYNSLNKFRKNEIPDVVANISAMRRDFAWEPKTSIQEGLLKTTQEQMLS